MSGFLKAFTQSAVVIATLLPGAAVARYYAPMESVWLQPDRMGQGAGTNYYLYVEAAPTMNVDPSGEVVVVNGTPRMSVAFTNTISAWRAYLMYLQLQLSNTVFTLQEGSVRSATGTGLGNTATDPPALFSCGMFAPSVHITIDFSGIAAANKKLTQAGYSFQLIPEEAIAHEFSHAYDMVLGIYNAKDPAEERRAYHQEEVFLFDYGWPLRPLATISSQYVISLPLEY